VKFIGTKNNTDTTGNSKYFNQYVRLTLTLNNYMGYTKICPSRLKLIYANGKCRYLNFERRVKNPNSTITAITQLYDDFGEVYIKEIKAIFAPVELDKSNSNYGYMPIATDKEDDYLEVEITGEGSTTTFAHYSFFNDEAFEFIPSEEEDSITVNKIEKVEQFKVKLSSNLKGLCKVDDDAPYSLLRNDEGFYDCKIYANDGTTNIANVEWDNKNSF
jgi:hypothetical protein